MSIGRKMIKLLSRKKSDRQRRAKFNLRKKSQKKLKKNQSRKRLRIWSVLIRSFRSNKLYYRNANKVRNKQFQLKMIQIKNLIIKPKKRKLVPTLMTLTGSLKVNIDFNNQTKSQPKLKIKSHRE